MKYLFQKNHHGGRTKEGYILLLTILVIGIVLSISMGIYTISAKEVVLASFLRDSSKALAAADRGAECALYWDRSTGPALNGLPYTIFATSSAYVAPAGLASAVCNDGTADRQLSSNAVTGWLVTTTAVQGATTFSLQFSDGTCVDVSVTKVGNDSTNVIADGYNTCNVAFSRRTQRELAVFTNI